MKFQPLVAAALIHCLGATGTVVALTEKSFADDAHAINVGSGMVATQAKGSAFATTSAQSPAAPFRTAAMLKQALPSNQWYSSVMFKQWSEPIHAHPATYRAGPEGFEIDYPTQSVVDAGGRGIDIAYQHHPALTLTPTEFKPADAKLDGIGDFSARISMADTQGHALLSTIVHGSPMSYYQLGAGDIRVHLAAGATPCAANDQAWLCVRIGQRAYAVFAPSDATWVDKSSANPVIHFGSSGRFFSVAVLPDDDQHTVNEFARHAFAFVTDTHVAWQYDAEHSKVTTRFSVDSKPMQNQQQIALMGLYLHQSRALSEPLKQPFHYQTILGDIQVAAQNQFETSYRYHGILPFWSGLKETADRDQLHSIMSGDAARAHNLYSNQLGTGTYWYGKALSATAQLMCVAEQEGDMAMRDALLTSLKQHLETWFKGDAANGYFVQDAKVGALFGYPEEYGSIQHLNDHHFHYGYWINAAAQVALRDPVWAEQNHWGGMVNLIAADIATAQRGRADFPFIRNFDAYEGHSWASGDADFIDGNNQESSSEAVNAWAGLILWGEATHNIALRDLGIWLYTTETESISDYWFDQRHTVFAKEFGKVVAAQVFGGRYSYNTWWTEEPRQIQGINLMPITPAALYLGRDPAYVIQFMSRLGPEKRAYTKRGMDDGTPGDIWQDVLMSYYALAEPQGALEHWKPKGSVELGETRSHTLFWLLSLKEMGKPDFTVTADTALYSVFNSAVGKRTYLAYNASDKQIEVHFSDGITMLVPAHELKRLN